MEQSRARRHTQTMTLRETIFKLLPYGNTMMTIKNKGRNLMMGQVPNGLQRNKGHLGARSHYKMEGPRRNVGVFLTWGKLFWLPRKTQPSKNKNINCQFNYKRITYQIQMECLWARNGKYPNVTRDSYSRKNRDTCAHVRLGHAANRENWGRPYNYLIF